MEIRKQVNWEDPESVIRAETEKATLEKDGYKLVKNVPNYVTQTSTRIYQKGEQ